MLELRTERYSQAIRDQDDLILDERGKKIDVAAGRSPDNDRRGIKLVRAEAILQSPKDVVPAK